MEISDGTALMMNEGAVTNIKKVVVWGASLSGIDCLKKYREKGVVVTDFVDRRVVADGEFHGVPLHSVEWLLNGHNDEIDAVVLAMSVDPSGPRQQLREAGINKPVLSFRQGTDVVTEVHQYLCPALAVKLNGSATDNYFLSAINRYIENIVGDVAVTPAGLLLDQLLESYPELKKRVCFLDVDGSSAAAGMKPITTEKSYEQPLSVIICETAYLRTAALVKKLGACFPNSRLITLDDIFSELPRADVPPEVFIPVSKTIYPVDIPDIKISHGVEFCLIDLPPRFFGMMPNGLGYVHNSIEQAGIKVETLDLDMIFYHRYHTHRLFDGVETVVAATGYTMKHDPWSIDVITDEWEKDEVIDYFNDEIEQLIEAIVDSKPKIIGFSLHGTNLLITREVVKRIRIAYPEGIIVVGGYDCIRPEFGPNLFDDFDYMVIFEAEVSLPGLVKEILAGNKPRNRPGIIAKDDRSELPFIAAPLFEALDSIPFPKYQWADIGLYRNYNGFQVTPIVLSRGCRWSRCTFCGERFNWRRRDPVCVVDEIEWLAKRGRNTFVFNDSDLSGDPAAVREVCEELIRRGITGITFSGQLRVQKGYTQDYFDVLAKAGFNTLTYGIDGWSKNTLKLHKKGYTVGMIEEVIRYTFNAGITVSMNLVVGIPYETEDDVDETISNILKNRGYIDGVENLNTLILATGGLYWESPEKYGIHFRGDKNAIYRENVKMIPTELWYSEDPYIDQAVRLDRVKRIVESVKAAGVRIGSYADWKLGKLNAG